VETDILHHGPHNGQTTRLGRKAVNLVSALSNIAEEAFDGIGRLNVAMHGRGKGIKGQQMLFILSQAPYRFGITLNVFGFKGLQVGECILFFSCFQMPLSSV
jgi:hypothetical protein